MSWLGRRHPNLVLFLGACMGEHGGMILLSEYMDGGTMEDFFRIRFLLPTSPKQCPGTSSIYLDRPPPKGMATTSNVPILAKNLLL